MKSEKKDGKEEICSVVHCNNLTVSDGYCDAHLERLELIKESYEHVKQLHLRTREDEKETTLERDREGSPTFGQTEEYIQ